MEMSDDSSIINDENRILRMIINIPIFAGMKLPEQRLVSRKFHLLTTGQDEIIIEQGDRSTNLYVIVEGKVLVSKKTATGEMAKVKILGPGDFFGEIAILRKRPRTARVSTKTHCKLLTIEARDFLEIYQYLTAQSQYNIQAIVEKRLAELAYI